MRVLRQIAVVVALVLLVASASCAGLIHEDVTYWYNGAKGPDSIQNPNTAWLEANMSALVIKIQQSVYDQASSAAMLAANGDPAQSGYLFAYSVTNLSLGDPAGPGITRVQVDWASQYLVYATVSHGQTLSGWEVDTGAGSAPAWKWTSTGPGITPGQTVGGFWAISNVGVDGECNSRVLLGGLGEPQGFAGKTTGPCPEPATFVSLFAGITGLGLMRRLRRK